MLHGEKMCAEHDCGFAGGEDCFWSFLSFVFVWDLELGTWEFEFSDWWRPRAASRRIIHRLGELQLFNTTSMFNRTFATTVQAAMSATSLPVDNGPSGSVANCRAASRSAW